MENIKCEYGCDKIAKHQMKNGKWCCSVSYHKCEFIRNKNSDGLKKSYESGKSEITPPKNNNWSSGKTFLTDDRIKSIFNKEEVFIENSKVRRGRIKELIIKENLIEYKCDGCGNCGEWMGKKIVLDLDHINGVNNDNRLENLRFLCPNCHSQTSTYKGRNVKNKNILNNFSSSYIHTDNEFTEAINSSYNIHQVCNKLNLSDAGNYKTIKNRMDKLSLCFKEDPTNGVMYKHTNDEFIEAVNSSYNIHQVRDKLCLSGGSNYKTIKNRMNKLGLSFKEQPTKCIYYKQNNETQPTNNCIDCNVEIDKRSKRCKSCSSVHNNIVNRKVERPPLSQLLKEVEETSYCAVGRKYGVSDNAVRKWIKEYEKNVK
jgi:hypothetical protein